MRLVAGPPDCMIMHVSNSRYQYDIIIISHKAGFVKRKRTYKFLLSDGEELCIMKGTIEF